MLPLPILPPLEKDWISGQALRSDVEVLRQTYGALHPGLYRYSTPAQIDQRITGLKRRLEKGARWSEAFVAFSEFAASIQCGHTFANPYNQSEAVQARLDQSWSQVPFDFVWIGDRMVVTRNLSENPRLTRGTEILSLNGRSTRQILSRMMRVARADGGNDAKRRSNLSVQGYGRHEMFDVFYGLLFPEGRGELRVRAKGISDAMDVTLLTAPMKRAQRESAVRAEAGSGGAAAPSATEGWTFRQSLKGPWVLTTPTWALYDSKFDWKRFLRDAFTQVAKSPGADLIVDVRGNEGGLDVGSEILRYVVQKPLPLSEFRRFTRYRSVPTPLRPNLSTWDRSFFDWKEEAGPAEFQPLANARLHRMVRYDDAASSSVIEPAAPYFGGRLVVLMGAENSSATFQFAQQVQQNRLGTLVGQPSGGNRRGINGGAFFFLTLPNSKIELDLPLIAFLPETPQPDAGILPDVPVAITVESIEEGEDPVMRAAERVLGPTRG